MAIYVFHYNKLIMYSYFYLTLKIGRFINAKPFIGIQIVNDNIIIILYY